MWFVVFDGTDMGSWARFSLFQDLKGQDIKWIYLKYYWNNFSNEYEQVCCNGESKWIYSKEY